MVHKVCTMCAAELSLADWEALPCIGYQVTPPYPPENDPGEVLEMRNCKCGSTITVLMDFTAIDLERIVDHLRTANPALTVKAARQLAIEELKQRSR